MENEEQKKNKYVEAVLSPDINDNFVDLLVLWPLSLCGAFRGCSAQFTYHLLHLGVWATNIHRISLHSRWMATVFSPESVGPALSSFLCDHSNTFAPGMGCSFPKPQATSPPGLQLPLFGSTIPRRKRNLSLSIHFHI